MTNMFKIHIFIIMITNCYYDYDFLRGMERLRLSHLCYCSLALRT